MGNSSRKLSNDEIESLADATGISSDKISECWETFSMFAENDSDHMSLNTVKQVVDMFFDDTMLLAATNGSLSPQTRNFLVERIFQVFDTDHNGFVDFKEFLIGSAVFKNPDPKTLAKFIYKIGDKDNSDGIDRDELKKLGSLLVAENGLAGNDFEKNFDLLVEYCFATYDKGNKGYLTEEEFGEAFQNLKEDKSLNLNSLDLNKE